MNSDCIKSQAMRTKIPLSPAILFQVTMLASGLLHAGILAPTGVAPAETTVTYPLRIERQEFAETIDDRKGFPFSWDFTETKGTYSPWYVSKPLLGQPHSVRVWIHATEKEAGTELTAVVTDKSGEAYGKRVKIDWVGWKLVDFPFAETGPTYDSGDRNRHQDKPLTFHAIHIEKGAVTSGTLLFGGVEATTSGTPRELVALDPSTRGDHDIFFGQKPVIDLSLRNLSANPVPGLSCKIEVEEIYSGKSVLSKGVDFSKASTGESSDTVSCELPLPLGVYRVKWSLNDKQGGLTQGTIDVAGMLPPCLEEAGPALRAYEKKYSPNGGIFGFIEPQLAAKLGAQWIRYENTVWSSYEKKRGVFDMAPLTPGLAPYERCGFDFVLLQTLYQSPKFRNTSEVDYAPAYGACMRHTAEAAGSKARVFELGNEDNGSTKMLYSEVVRHGAAGVRIANPDALIANSGTAFIDTAWIRMQAKRGIFEDLDLIFTHPYSWDKSPEEWGIYDQLRGVNGIIDELGGMKFQQGTEFGWQNPPTPEARRADWIPRHVVMATAAGMERDGLYTWQRDYGIMNSGVPTPAAGTMHALAKFLEGHRFAGLLHRGNDFWASVWERAGVPLVVAWSPAGDFKWTVDAGEKVSVKDHFGNPLSAELDGKKVKLQLAQAPVYLTNVNQQLLAEATANRIADEKERLLRCIAAAKLHSGHPLAFPDAKNGFTAAGVAAGITAWAGQSGPIRQPEQAVVAQALRYYDAAARFENAASLAGVDAPARTRADFRAALGKSTAEDLSIPSLRYLLEGWDRLAAEESLARELKSRDYADRLLATQRIFSVVCARFLKDGERQQFALWPYLYSTATHSSLNSPLTSGTSGGSPVLQERLLFIPGQPKTVQLRINSYSKSARNVKVDFKLPDGWRCEGLPAQLSVKPGGAVTEIKITCPSGQTAVKPEIIATLKSEGLPDRRVLFDDIEVQDPLELSVEPVQGLLPETPLKITLSSPGDKTFSGTLRLMREGDSRALARVAFQDVAPGKPVNLDVPLKQVSTESFNKWPLIAHFILPDGIQKEKKITVDFACAVRTDKPPVMDGLLTDWKRAAPLNINDDKYTKGTFGGKWSPEDCSATTYLMWDEQNLYFAAVVQDQTFNQNLSGLSIWMQDSIQIALAKDESSKKAEFGLALTPKGAEVGDMFDTTPDPLVKEAKLKVTLSQGQAVYEAAIPWSKITGIVPKEGETLRFSVLVNDDDAIVPRRFIERYGGIAYDKEVRHFGYLKLLPYETIRGAAAVGGNFVMNEDFEEYPDDTCPDAWERFVHQMPCPVSEVLPGVGRNGTKALRLSNEIGSVPYHYLNLVRALPGVHALHDYEMTFWVRGKGLENPDEIIGVCTDKWGNEDYSYAPLGDLKDDWKKVVFRFPVRTAGKCNLIIRNMSKIGELLIDDITVSPVKE
jgi:hypothetical protein